MALTRKFLKGMGLSDEQIESIIDNHSETVSGLKDEIDKLKEEAGQLKDVQKELNDLKNGKDWKGEYDKAKKDLDDLRAEVAGKEQAAKVREAYKDLLKAESIDPKRYDVILRATDLKGAKLDKDGKLENAEALKAQIKADWGDFVVEARSKGAEVATPPENGGAKLTRADIYAKDENGRYKLSTEARQKALVENNLI